MPNSPMPAEENRLKTLYCFVVLFLDTFVSYALPPKQPKTDCFV